MFESKENSYWGSRVRKFVIDKDDKQGWISLQQAIKTDSAVWSLFAAFLMTVGFSGLFVGANNFNLVNDGNRIGEYIYVGCMFGCCGFAFLAVIIGTLKFIYYCGFPAEMMDKAIANDKQFGPSEFVYISFVFIAIACLAGSCIFYNFGVMIEVIIFFLIMVILFIYIIWTHVRSFRLMGMSKGLLCG